MDALKLLKAEIANKRKQLTELGVVEPDKKYFKQAELAEKLEEEGRKKQKIFQQSLDEVSQEGTKSEDEAGVSGAHKTTQFQLPLKEVVRRLRELNQPIRLFGETDEEVLSRLKEVESNIGESVKGMRNDLQQALKQVDDEYLKELMGAGDSSGIPGSSADADKVNAFDVKVLDTEKVTLDDMAAEADGKFGKGDAEYDVEFMIRFFKLILAGWAQELNERSIEEKQSQKGRLDAAIHTQTVEYLKPFLKRLNKKSKYFKHDVLGNVLVESIVDVVKWMLVRNYLKANEAYLLCAVGNAAWPIGATMVGIHARPGREKLSSRNIAHVMNNETHRKFITGVKRLMARCQRLYPTEPSKSVDFDTRDRK